MATTITTRVEPAANLGEVLIRLDEADLQNVFGDVGTTGHTQRMTVERIAIARDQSLERVSISGKNTLNNQLICVVQIFRILISPQGCLRCLHDNRVTYFLRF